MFLFGVLLAAQGQGWVFRGYPHLYGGRCRETRVPVKVKADSGMTDGDTRPLIWASESEAVQRGKNGNKRLMFLMSCTQKRHCNKKKWKCGVHLRDLCV